MEAGKRGEALNDTSGKTKLIYVALVGFGLGGRAHSEEVLLSDSAMVLLWSSQAADTIVTVGGKFPCREAVYKGIVHVAIYDAVVGIEGWYEPYTSHAAAPVAAYADDRVNAKALRHSRHAPIPLLRTLSLIFASVEASQ